MRRALALALLLTLTALPAAPAGAQSAGDSPGAVPAAGEGTRFVHITDTHAGSAGWARSAAGLLATVRALDPQPEFLVHGGDVTETGAAGQYQSYADWLAALGIPGFHLPGNHDARWLDAGKAEFRRRFRPAGDLNWSFDRAGVHFVLLDVTIDAETHGHVDGAALAWLRQDLARVGPGQPVLVFLHHPPAYPPASFMDNDEDLFAVLRGHNVRGVFAGHGHLDLQWQVNGIPVFMTKAASDAGLKVIDIAGGRMRVLDSAAAAAGAQAGAAPAPVAEVDLAPPAEPGEARIAGLEPVAGGIWWLKVSTRGLPEGAKAWYRIGSGAWQPMNPALVVPGDWVAQVDTAGLPPGRHRLHVVATAEPTLPGQPAAAEPWLRADLGPWWIDHRDFGLAPAAAGAATPGVPAGPGTPATPGAPADPVAPQPAAPQPAWRFQAGGGIQAAPAVAPDGTVYAGARDGMLYALAPATGQVRWRYATEGPIAGSPALEPVGGQVIAGDTAGWLHAVDAGTGLARWRQQLAGPILAEPLVAGGRIYVGDAAGGLTALDARTGQVAWRYAAGGAIRARATAGAGLIYAGAWDGKVHAVDAATGAPAWQTALPGSIYYAPANAPFLYYRGRLFVTRTPPTGEAGLYALDARTGAVLWSRAGSFGYSSPVLHGGAVVVHKTGGAIHAFDPLTGEPAPPAGAAPAAADTGVTAFDGGAASHGSDFVLAGLGGLLVAVGADGTPRWSYRVGEAYLYARPASAGIRVYAGAMDGSLLALDAPALPAPPLTLGTPGLRPAAGAEAAFPDVASHWAQESVLAARAMGLVGGMPDGTFRPAEPVTRAQMAAILVRYLWPEVAAPPGAPAGADSPPAGADPPAGATPVFADLAGHWAEAAVYRLAGAGLVAGVTGPDGAVRFEPDRPVTRAEAAVLLSRILGRSSPSPAFGSQLADLDDHWSAALVRAMEEVGLVAGIPGAGGSLLYQPDQPVTRAAAVTMVMRLALGS